MAANCATKEEFIVGWGFHPNRNNIVQQNSNGCENLGGEHKALTTATNEAETRMNSGFARGGGYLTSSPTRLSRHTKCTLTLRLSLKKCGQLQFRHPATGCEQRADQSALTLRLPLKKSSQRLFRHPAAVLTRYPIVVALRDLKQKFDTS